MKILKFVVTDRDRRVCFAVTSSSTILSFICAALGAMNIKVCKPFEFEVKGFKFRWDDEKIIESLDELDLLIDDKMSVKSDDWLFECILIDACDGKGNVFTYPIILDNKELDGRFDMYRFNCMDLRFGLSKMMNDNGKSYKMMKCEREFKKNKEIVFDKIK